MRIDGLNWMQVEDKLKSEDRCVLPLGCTEQHAYLSLATDSILAERIATEAARPIGVPVFPVLPYGMTPSFMAYPGTVTLSLDTYLALLKEILESLEKQGFRRIVIVNGHGGNTPAKEPLVDFCGQGNLKVTWHDWWRGPKVWKVVQSIEKEASHASWMENFPWTRVDGVSMPKNRKALIPFYEIQGLDPSQVRDHIGDGSFGGPYELADEVTAKVWAVGVEETRDQVLAI